MATFGSRISQRVRRVNQENPVNQSVKIWRLSILLSVGVLTSSRIALAQCCGDCNGDGTVSVSELVSAVTIALDGCSNPEAEIHLKNVTLPTFSARINSRVSAGEVSFTSEGDFSPRADIVFFRITKTDARSPSASLLANNEFLRWVTTNSAGNVRDWSLRHVEGFTGFHAFIVEWDAHSTSITIDGVEQTLSDRVDNPTLNAGSTLTLGSSDAQDVTFHDVSFVAQE